jgi:hypothetical protein
MFDTTLETPGSDSLQIHVDADPRSQKSLDACGLYRKLESERNPTRFRRELFGNR